MGQAGVTMPEEHLPSRPLSVALFLSDVPLTLEATTFSTGSQDKPPADYSEDRACNAPSQVLPS